MKRPQFLDIGQEFIRPIPKGLPILINPEFKGSSHFPRPFPVVPKKRDRLALFLNDNSGNIPKSSFCVKSKKEPLKFRHKRGKGMPRQVRRRGEDV
jgi:hypothetical protein